MNTLQSTILKLGARAMKRMLFILVLFSPLLTPSLTHAQVSNYRTIAINGQGRPLSGVSVAICQGLATTGASITANVATLTMASNPMSAGFTLYIPGQQGLFSTIVVYGFSGADAFLNGTWTISGLTSTSISFPVIHNPYTASSNGRVIEEGLPAGACLPLATVYTDATGSNAGANPFTTDGLGNVSFFAAAGVYEMEYFGGSVNATVQLVTVPCVPNSACPLSAFPASAIVGVSDTQTLSNKTLTEASSGNSITLLNAQANAGAITGNGTAQVIYTYTIPASTVANLKGIRVTASWSHSTGSASVTYAFTLNGVSIWGSSNSITGLFGLMTTILNTGAATGTVFGFGTFGNINTVASSGLAWSSNQVLQITFNVASTDAVTPIQWIVEVMQ
jgi:hypothetical protein